MRYLLIILGALFIAGAASAGQWRTCSDTHKGGNIAGSISKPGTLCYDFDSDDDSVFMSTGHCEHVDILMERDIDGSDTTAVASAQSAVAPGPYSSRTNFSFKIENINLDGVASTSTEAIYGVGASWVWINVETDPSGGDARIVLRCNS